MNSSFQERVVWITLVSLLVVLGAYFVVAGFMLQAGVTQLVAYVPLFAITVVLLVASMAAASIVAAIVGRPEPADERDRLFGWRAESSSSWIVGVGVLMAITAMVLGVDNVWTAHLLLLSLLLSEVVKATLQLVFYRRGM